MRSSSFSPEALASVRTQWPSLQEIPPDAPPGASLRYAASNIRSLLKAEWPQARFWVALQRYSMGNNISIEWAGEGKGLSQPAIETLVSPFIHSWFDGSTDSTISVPTNREFRELFGSMKHLHVHRADPSREASYKATEISKALPKANKKARSGPRF